MRALLLSLFWLFGAVIFLSVSWTYRNVDAAAGPWGLVFGVLSLMFAWGYIKEWRLKL